MAEDDGSFDHAKKHGKGNNHEVLDHVKSFAADNTRVANPSGPNVDSRKEILKAKVDSIDANIVGNMNRDLNVDSYVSSSLLDAKNNKEIANAKDKKRTEALKTANLK